MWRLAARLCLIVAWVSWQSTQAAAQLAVDGPQVPRPNAVDPPDKADGHWGEDQVGFRWVESDSVDARWNEMDTGPCLASALATPTGLVNKSVAVRVGRDRQAAVCFDVTSLSFRCGWRGGFLTFTPARFGIVAPPTIAGDLQFVLPSGPTWQANSTRYHGYFLHGPHVVFSYTVDDTAVLDSCWAEELDGGPARGTMFVRSLEIAATARTLSTVVADSPTQVRLVSTSSQAQLVQQPAGPTRLVIAPHAEPIRCDIILAKPAAVARESEDLNERLPQADQLRDWIRPGPPRWGDPLVTRGRLGANDRAYTVDTVELPFENPFRALLFVGGHDFFSTPGRAAICTLHGDVWLLDGLDASLQRVTWRRYATGLYQPLGLRIVRDTVYVLGRDQITRLHDHNQDGEADEYECFNGDTIASPGGHDFSTCLETDPAGNFYYASQLGVHRISADGQRYETIATGLRNANGLGVGRNGVITVAPQEGEWTPASAVFQVRPHGYYGYGGPRLSADRPQGYDPPLFWLPRLLDNSTGGQAWVESNRWGPLAGQLLTFSFGQCRILVNLLEPQRYSLPESWPVAGDQREVNLASGGLPTLPEAAYVQGGSFALPGYFESGIMRGRFSPWDGQLYVSGLRGWVSAATHDGCFQRVRYTAQPLCLPVQVRTLQNGLALTFSSELDPLSAADQGSYFVEQWNYVYGPQYGSEEYSVTRTGRTGRDRVAVRSATRLDPQTVFLEFERVQPVMQLAVSYVLETAAGQTLRNTYYHTINRVPAVELTLPSEPPDAVARPTAVEPELSPGVLWHFTSRLSQANPDADLRQVRELGWTFHDVRVGRLAALSVRAGTPPTSRLPPGPFQANAVAYLRVPLRDRYTFLVSGHGEVQLRINGEDVLSGPLENESLLNRRTVALRQGDNLLELRYESPPAGDAGFRLQWSGESFGWESVPPTVLFHAEDDANLARSTASRLGQEVVMNGRCLNCHFTAADADPLVMGDRDSSDLHLSAPDLTLVGQRFTRPWLTQWIADPAQCRPHAEMPQVLSSTDPGSRQAAADLAAYLASWPAISTSIAEAPSQTENLSSLTSNELQRDGELLFEQLACLACHAVSGTAAEDSPRVALRGLAAKYQPGALRAFLRAPHQHYPDSRMPDFQLSEPQIERLLAYLVPYSTATLAAWTQTQVGDAQRGAALYGSLRCGACHLGGPQADAKSTRTRLPLNPTRAGGCVADERPAAHTGPWYRISASQRQAVVALLHDDPWQLTESCDAERTEQVMRRLQCSACHDRDAELAARWERLTEEGSGRVPESLPNLTWTGEKLHAGWLAKYLAGERPAVTRPWLQAQMPRFPRSASLLARGLRDQHGIPATEPTPSPDPTLVEPGRRLVSKTGLDCRQCHAVGQDQPQGDERTQLAYGINFALLRDRLRPEFYQRFVLDPARFDIRTKMPKLAPDGRTTPIREFWDGNAPLQFAAIWQYLMALPNDVATAVTPSEPSAEKD